MLKYNPCERITAKSALSHVFFFIYIYNIAFIHKLYK